MEWNAESEQRWATCQQFLLVIMFHYTQVHFTMDLPFNTMHNLVPGPHQTIIQGPIRSAFLIVKGIIRLIFHCTLWKRIYLELASERNVRDCRQLHLPCGQGVTAMCLDTWQLEAGIHKSVLRDRQAVQIYLFLLLLRPQHNIFPYTLR